MSKKYPPIKNWTTAWALHEQRGGDSGVWIRKFEALREWLIHDLMAQETLSRQQAEEKVEKKYVGMRQHDSAGRPGLAASPTALKILRAHPEIGQVSTLGDWKTSNMLLEECGGSNDTWKKRFEAVRAWLMSDLVYVKGMSKMDAAALIEREYVGMRKPPKNVDTPAISPKGLQLLREHPDIDGAPLGDWHAPSMLTRLHGGSNGKWKNKLKRLAGELTGDILEGQDGMKRPEARGLVEHHLIGSRRLSNRKFSIAASPTVQQILNGDASEEHQPEPRKR